MCTSRQHGRCKDYVFSCIVLALKVLRLACRGCEKLTLFRLTPRSQAGPLPCEVCRMEEYPECWHANKHLDHPVCLSTLYHIHLVLSLQIIPEVEIHFSCSLFMQSESYVGLLKLHLLFAQHCPLPCQS